MSEDNLSGVLSQAVRLSPEDQARLIESLKQRLVTAGPAGLENFSNAAHPTSVRPAVLEQAAADFEVDNERCRRDFEVEDEQYGKLMCSYHLDEDFLYRLDMYFSEVFVEERGDKTVGNLNHAFMCREEAQERRTGKIRHPP